MVQPLPSSQTLAGSTAAPLQAPAWHASPAVQALASSHGRLLLALTQPVFGSQLSLVQRFLSSQSTDAPAQPPPLQASPWLHALPSSHGKVLAANAQAPVTALQLSVVQALLSLHTALVPETQALFAQLSPSVQALPSVHGEALALCVQPVLASQASSLHGLPSSQPSLLPGAHVPLLHTSPTVHTLPSASHEIPLAEET